MLSFGLENRATSFVSTPGSTPLAYRLLRKPSIPSPRAHTMLVTLVPCHTPPPATRINTSLDSRSRPFVLRVSYILPSSPLPHPSHVL